MTRETREARIDTDELRRLLADAAHAWTGRRWNALVEFASHGPDLLDEIERLRGIEEAARAILNPARGDASWLHTVEFDDLRAALEPRS